MARKKTKQSRKRGWRRRWRWLFGRGCLPMTIVLSGGLVVLLNIVTYWRAPYWVTNTREYIIGGRLGMSLLVLLALQLLATWSMGLLGAGRGVRAAGGQGGLLRLRLRAIRRRLRPTVIAVLVLRIVALIVVLATVLFTYTRILGFRLDSDWLSDMRGAFRIYPLLVLVALVLAMLQWLIGPSLRLRYSTALGAMAATWTRQTGGERLSSALSLRLGLGMLGALMVLWLPTIVYIVYASIVDPYSSSNYQRSGVSFIEMSMRVTLTLILVLVVHLGGQIALPELYMAVTQSRLKRRAARAEQPDRAAFAVSPAQAAD